MCFTNTSLLSKRLAHCEIGSAAILFAPAYGMAVILFCPLYRTKLHSHTAHFSGVRPE
jgi:hypothetical protein